MARAARWGVRCRPSRSGFSPMASMMARNWSSMGLAGSNGAALSHAAQAASYNGRMTSRKSTQQIREVPVDLIRPGSQQARRHFDADALGDLAQSIRESGVVQPVVLRTRVWGYELLAGERRWRASQLAGLHEI